MKLNIYQIYYDDYTKGLLRPGFTPYYNEECSVFFESGVIRDCVKNGEHCERDYFGVVGPKFVGKITQNSGMPFRGFSSIKEFASTHDDCDFISLIRTPDNDNHMANAEWGHPGFIEIMDGVLRCIRFDVEYKAISNYAMCNFFIATRRWWEHYSRELLLPFMKFIEHTPPICALQERVWSDAKYGTLPPHLRDSHGRMHYTFHPFLVERLPAVFMMKYGDRYKSVTYV